jgi:hypothetical protein
VKVVYLWCTFGYAVVGMLWSTTPSTAASCAHVVKMFMPGLSAHVA